MTASKKLIEVALPLEAINTASAREKSIRHGHPSTLHLWWARRPLASARAVIFASLVDDPDDPNALPAFVQACRELDGRELGYEPKNVHTNGDTPRMRLFDFIEKLVTWEATTDEKILNKARELIQIATGGNPPPLLDPFAGGGSIPLEAQRLGLEAHASDLNPVAVMINKAQIEIPPRFANLAPINPRDRENNTTKGMSWKGASGLASDVRYYGEWMREKAWEKIGHLYPTHNGETVIAWLWARTVKCVNPACNAQMPLVTSFELSKKKGKQAWIEYQIDKESKTVKFEVRTGIGKAPESPKMARGAKFKCLSCDEMPSDQYIKDEGIAGRMGEQLLAIVTEGKNGRNYHSPQDYHIHIANSAKPSWEPKGSIPDDRRSMFTPLYGLTEFRDLFTPRQLVALTTFSDLVAEARQQAYADAIHAGMADDGVPLRDGGRGALAYAEAVSVYLAFAVDRQAERTSTIASWQSSADFIRGTFARQALPMVWDYAEANPFSSSTGNFVDNCEWVAKATESIFWDFNIINSYNSARQVDASSNQSQPVRVLSTDPPYYDNIGYADLSDFFYVWMRKSLRSVYPDIFGTVLVPKEPELIASPYRHGGKAEANAHFENGMHQTFGNIRQFISHEYPLTVYYAFKQQDADTIDDDKKAGVKTQQTVSTGWETMLTSLIDSGFSIDGTWPMRTERSVRTVSLGTNALASSIVLVCRPRAEGAPTSSRRAFLDDLRRELPKALRDMQSGNIAPVDLAQASIGPGIAIYSRYSAVSEADGSKMTVRTALGLINEALDEYLSEQDGDLDADTRFAVAWFEQFGFNEGDFGQADVLARAKNTSVGGVESADVVVSTRGKVKLVHWSNYDAGKWNPQQDKRPTIWEATHHLIERLNTHGETGSAQLMEKMPPEMAAEARQLAYRLYNICERKGWADHARDYNALVTSWSDIGTQAAQLRQEAGQATKQLNLFGDE
jgi:putative DNA methylase